jgi:glycosyltransferase involved in cell wall biosynthesis
VGGWVEEGVVEYLGETDDVRPYLADAGVYVLPSFYREGTSRPVLEAMSMGRPVIIFLLTGRIFWHK